MSADFTGFNISHATYKVVQDTDIKVSVFLPPGIPTVSPRPVIIRWHGGFWITGKRDQPLWFGPWIADLARRQHAVLVSADYRLLPEATGSELLSDLASFMSWLPNLPAHLQQFNVTPDLARTLVAGESAGGWCSVQTALLHGSGLHGFPDASSPVKIRAAISSYGVLDLKTKFYLEADDKVILGHNTFPISVADDVMAAAKSKKRVLTGVEVPGRLDLCLAAVQHGKMVGLMGAEPEKYPLEVLDMVKSAPPMWVYHGKEDSAVPMTASTAFVEKLKRTHPGTPAKLTLEPGEHGFDGEAKITEGWMKEGIDWIAQYWP